MIGTTRSRVSFFMNKFRKLGFISYNGKIEVNNSLLTAVLYDKPQINSETSCGYTGMRAASNCAEFLTRAAGVVLLSPWQGPHRLLHFTFSHSHFASTHANAATR